MLFSYFEKTDFENRIFIWILRNMTFIHQIQLFKKKSLFQKNLCDLNFHKFLSHDFFRSIFYLFLI